MHKFVTSKNVKWCHLIWPTLYMTQRVFRMAFLDHLVIEKFSSVFNGETEVGIFLRAGTFKFWKMVKIYNLDRKFSVHFCSGK